MLESTQLYDSLVNSTEHVIECQNVAHHTFDGQFGWPPVPLKRITQYSEIFMNRSEPKASIPWQLQVPSHASEHTSSMPCCETGSRMNQSHKI